MMMILRPWLCVVSATLQTMCSIEYVNNVYVKGEEQGSCRLRASLEVGRSIGKCRSIILVLGQNLVHIL